MAVGHALGRPLAEAGSLLGEALAEGQRDREGVPLARALGHAEPLAVGAWGEALTAVDAVALWVGCACGEGVADVQGEGATVREGDPVADRQREGEAVEDGHWEGDPVAVAQLVAAAPDAVPRPLLVKDGVLVAHAVVPTLTVAVMVPVEERLEDPLVEAHNVAHPLAEGDRVADAHTEAVADMLGDPVADKQRDVVGVAVGLADGGGDLVAHGVGVNVTDPVRDELGLPLKDAHSVALTETAGDRVPDVHWVAMREAIGDGVEERQREVVGLTLGL